MDTHIGKVCSKAFRGLYYIRQIGKYLSAESTKCLIHAFVTLHSDYCNSDPTLFCINVRDINMTDFKKFLMQRLGLLA